MVLLLYVWLIENFNMFIILLFSFSNLCHNFWSLNFKNAEMFLFKPFKLIHTYSLLHCAFHKCRTGIYVDYVVALSGWRFLNCSTTPLECWHKIRIPGFWFVFLLKLSKWSLDICLKREKNGVHFYSSGKMKERNW